MLTATFVDSTDDVSEAEIVTEPCAVMVLFVLDASTRVVVVFSEMAP